MRDPGTAVDEPFRLDLADARGGRIYCLAMPQILERFPFSRGLPNCNDLAGLVVDDYLNAADRSGRPRIRAPENGGAPS